MKALEQVILVDESDTMIGTAEKMKAHEDALLHRAFSVFIYRRVNHEIEILLQKRQIDKYHCGGLWTNTCCSHPRVGEETVAAGQRRLSEEMSLVLPLESIGKFLYKASFSNGLTEHEYDHVLLGEYDGIQPIILDPNEAEAYRWVTVALLEKELNALPEQFTPWFNLAFQFVLEKLCYSS